MPAQNTVMVTLTYNGVLEIVLRYENLCIAPKMETASQRVWIPNLYLMLCFSRPSTIFWLKIFWSETFNGPQNVPFEGGQTDATEKKSLDGRHPSAVHESVVKI